jgi:NhaA family Na+:H+ antiporter
LLMKEETNKAATLSDTLRGFLASEAAGGIVLMGAACAALIIANSSIAPHYFSLLKTYVFGLSVLHWINDGLMAFFFLLVGLEIKRELIEGQLSTWHRRALPGICALGGIIVPALIFGALNWRSDSLRGWAIPTATDIAFALGILTLLGPRVPLSLKVFLTALAILDDLVAIVVIAVFYSDSISVPWIFGSIFVILFLLALNYVGEKRLPIYLFTGALLWICVFMSGLHATLAGVALALTIPMDSKQSEGKAASSLHALEHRLQPFVAYLIVPVFGFANAGVALGGITWSSLIAPLPLGVAAGLFFGKQIGVFGSAWLAIKLDLAALPLNASYRQIYGVALLCGVGFTMSLFIGLLAFPLSIPMQDEVKIGVLMGSILSGLAAVALLVLPAKSRPKARLSS